MKSIYNYKIPINWRNNFIIKTEDMLVDKYDITESFNDCVKRVYNFLVHIIDSVEWMMCKVTWFARVLSYNLWGIFDYVLLINSVMSSIEKLNLLL